MHPQPARDPELFEAGRAQLLSFLRDAGAAPEARHRPGIVRHGAFSFSARKSFTLAFSSTHSRRGQTKKAAAGTGTTTNARGGVGRRKIEIVLLVGDASRPPRRRSASHDGLFSSSQAPWGNYRRTGRALREESDRTKEKISRRPAAMPVARRTEDPQI